ncbi:trypsin-like peptidase domain-containing protein [Streptomyces sp. NPDC053048]|uniref:VMAP-C domain-containing protein n=1 Tax=Streptomyces sp. NPDC053048 TaxID=3365694 RepID=UPI0037D23119
MSALEGTARRAVVRISERDGGYDRSGARFWGSGFFIAPGWVLTCAHVVGNGGGDVLRGERAVDVTDWHDRTTEGRVALALPMPEEPDRPPRPWAMPDLALLKVDDADDAECLWLSDRSTIVPADISLHGWSRDTGELAPRHGIGTASGGDGRDGTAMLLRGEIPVAGCSGGPVVDTGRGAVIGVSKGRGKDTAGLAVPITALRRIADDRPGRDRLHAIVRAHDRHHFDRYRALGTGGSWPGLQQRLREAALRAPAGGFTPRLRTHLFARLAELTPPGTPGEVMQLVGDTKRRVIQDPYQPGVEHDPRTWREGVGLLYDLRDGGRAKEPAPERDLELEAVLLYAARVAAAVSRLGHDRDVPHLRDLSGWLTGEAEPLPDVIREEIQQILHGGSAAPAALLEPAPAGTVELRKPERRDVAPGPRRDPSRRRGDVIVEIDTLLYGDRYPWRVKLLLEDGVITPLRSDEEGVPRAGLREALREPVAAALLQGDVGEHLAELRVVLPRELFDEALDEWRLLPPGAGEHGFDPHTMPLGHRRVVVLQDRKRRDRPATPEWRRRFNGTNQGPMTAVPLRREAPVQGHDGPRREGGHAAYGRLSEAAVTAVPVYCGEVAQGAGAMAMDAALAAGHAVVLWRRCAPGHTDCAEFHERAARLVCEAGTAEGLHRRIRNLRIRCGDPDFPDPDALWARSVALLSDDPDRPPGSDTPLRAPGARWDP